MQAQTKPPEKPAVSVIIPCRNEVASIEACLASILRQEEPEGGIEVLVADGMSDDGTREVLDQLRARDPRVVVINNPRRIVSAGLNEAIRCARAEVIIRMDAHTEYDRDYVVRCMDYLQKTGADNVGGPARTKSVTYMEKAIAAAYHSPFAVGGALFHDPEYSGWVDTVTYGCWRKEVFERFGYFDEDLVRNQDDEHNLRIIRGGGRIWQSAEIKSWYHPRASLGALFQQYLQYGYWKVRVIQKHRIPASWRHIVPGGFLLTLALFAFVAVIGAMFSTLSSWGAWTSWTSALALTSLALLYLLAVASASCVTARRTQWSLFPALMLVFPCYHFGYGYGFLRGLWDFIACRRDPSQPFIRLTRKASP